MPPIKDLVAAGFGTPAQKRADEQRRRRERLRAAGVVVAPIAGPSHSAGELPSRPVGPEPGESGPTAAEPHTSNDLETSRLRKEVDALKEANEDLYTKLADRDAVIGVLEKEHNDTKDQLRAKRQEVGGINQNLFASEKALRQAEEALEKEHAAHKKTRSERDENNAQKEDYVNLSKSQNVAIKADAEERDELRKELDNLTADLQIAHSTIDDLELRLERQESEAQQAKNFLQIIHQELDQQFEDDEISLTPETLETHLRDTLSLATKNRHASGTSNTSSQHDGTHNASRPSTGQRKVSIAQELADVDEYDESGDEDGSNTSNDLHIPKRRPQSAKDGVVSASSSSDEEKEQKIRAQAEQIEQLKAEHQREVEELRAAQQKEVDDLKDDIASKKKYLEKAADEIERVRDERIRAANGYSVEQNNPTRNAVTKHDAATQTAAVETPETYADEQPILITSPAGPADLWEAFKQSPSWLRMLIVSCSLLLLFFGLTGWLKTSTAQGPLIDYYRYHQAKYASIGFRSRFEHLIGFDTRLLS